MNEFREALDQLQDRLDRLDERLQRTDEFAAKIAIDLDALKQYHRSKNNRYGFSA